MIDVSVLLPVFNGAATIGQALDSLRQQTLPTFEVLVVDDGSTDETAQIVKAYARTDSRISLIQLPHNKGVSQARNTALAQAQGTWIAVLDADDWFDPARLETLLGQAQSLGADIILDNMSIYCPGTHDHVAQTCFNQKNTQERIGPQDLFNRDNPFVSFAMGYTKPLFRRAFIEAHGLRYDERYALGEDFLFLSENLLSGAQAYLVSYAGYHYRFAPSPLFPAAAVKAGASKRGYDQVIAACHDLLVKYNDCAPLVAKAIQKRIKNYTQLALAREVKEQFAMGERVAACRQILTHPTLLLFIGRLLLLRCRRMLRCRCF